MNADPSAEGLWDRAKLALKVSRHCLSLSPDAAASRAYYAAFYAVSALFALGGRTFKKHSALEAAVHRDLVKPGLWAAALGEQYSALVRMRNVSDYQFIRHVSGEEAKDALAAAGDILRAVAKGHPEAFGRLEECDPGQ